MKEADNQPSGEAYQEAAKAGILEYCRLDPDHNDTIEDQFTKDEQAAVGHITLTHVKQCLTEEIPVIFGFIYYWEDPIWDKSGKDDIWTMEPLPFAQRHTPPPKRDKPDKDGDWTYGSHTVLAVGFDVNKRITLPKVDWKDPKVAEYEIGAVLCQNSWGVNAENWQSAGGLFWMPFSFIRDWEASDDFWMIRELEIHRNVKKPIMFRPEEDIIILKAPSAPFPGGGAFCGMGQTRLYNTVFSELVGKPYGKPFFRYFDANVACIDFTYLVDSPEKVYVAGGELLHIYPWPADREESRIDKSEVWENEMKSNPRLRVYRLTTNSNNYGGPKSANFTKVSIFRHRPNPKQNWICGMSLFYPEFDPEPFGIGITDPKVYGEKVDIEPPLFARGLAEFYGYESDGHIYQLGIIWRRSSYYGE